MPDDIQALFDRWKSGDDSARNPLIDLVYKRLHTRLQKLVGRNGHVRATDVANAAVMRILKNVQRQDTPTMGSLFRYSYRHLDGALRDEWRFNQCGQGVGQFPRDNSDSPAPAGPDPPETTNDPVRLFEWGEFHREVDHLPEAEREVIELRYYGEYKMEEIATMLRVSRRTVYDRWVRALQRLKRALGGTPFVL